MPGTVTVALKHPNGLTLRVMEEYTRAEPVLGGGTRDVKEHRDTGRSFELKGNSAPHGVQLITPGGYALTTGIDADLWDAWLAQNKDTRLVTERLVFAMPREDSTAAKAKEQGEIRSGLERLDPSKPPKVGLGVNITAADVKAA